MSVLENFKVFDFSEGSPYVSITRNGMTFNKSVTQKLGHPLKVVLLIDEDSKQVAIQACTDATVGAVDFFKSTKNVASVRWTSKDLLNTLQEMMGWQLDRESYRVDGKLLKQEKAMLFDLKTAVELK